MDFGLPVEPLLARQTIAGFLAPARPHVMPRWPPANIPPPEWVPIPINLFRAPCHCGKTRLPPEYLPCTTCRISPMPGIIQPNVWITFVWEWARAGGVGGEVTGTGEGVGGAGGREGCGVVWGVGRTPHG